MPLSGGLHIATAYAFLFNSSRRYPANISTMRAFLPPRVTITSASFT